MYSTKTSPGSALWRQWWRVVVATTATAGAFSVVANSDGKVASPSVLRKTLEPAARDPFFMPPPAPLAVVAPPPAVLAVPEIPRVPVPRLTFTGRMRTPEGQTMVLARWGDGSLARLEPGKVFANGYRVERMSADMVELRHPQTQTVVQLVLPPAPRFETR